MSNNNLHQFMRTIAVGIYLNRTVVVTPDVEINFHSLERFPAINRLCVKRLSDAEVRALVPPGSNVLVYNTDKDDSLPIPADYYGATTNEVKDWRHHWKVGVACLSEHLKIDLLAHELLHVSTKFVLLTRPYFMDIGTETLRALLESFQFAPLVEEVFQHSELAVAPHGFVGIHMHHFGETCQHLADIFSSNPFITATFLAICDMPWEFVALTLRQYNRDPEKTLIYVAHDGTFDLSHLISRPNVRTYASLNVSHIPADQAPWIDFYFSTRSALFLANPYSTYAEYIALFRENSGHARETNVFSRLFTMETGVRNVHRSDKESSAFPFDLRLLALGAAAGTSLFACFGCCSRPLPLRCLSRPCLVEH
jgi:hypothetical protein